MKQKAVYPKVATDLFWIQLFWSLGFLGVMFVIHVIKVILGSINGNEINNYFSAVFVAANIFMLVIGIISTYGFLGFYVGNGVTRRDYFKGATLSTIGLSFALPIMASIVSVLERWFINLTHLYNVKTNPFVSKGMEEDSNLLGDIITSVIISPFVDLHSNWLLAILIFALNLLTYFVVGWFIGTSFYRFHILIGLGVVLLSIAILFTADGLLNVALKLPVHEVFTSLSLSLPVSALAILIILGIVLWVIRRMTKKVAVKL